MNTQPDQLRALAGRMIDAADGMEHRAGNSTHVLHASMRANARIVRAWAEQLRELATPPPTQGVRVTDEDALFEKAWAKRVWTDNSGSDRDVARRWWNRRADLASEQAEATQSKDCCIEGGWEANAGFARAWHAVARTLTEVMPGWDTPDGTCDMDRACAAIRSFATPTPDAAQGAVAAIIRDVCRMEPADSNRSDVATIRISDLQRIVERYTRSAADAAVVPDGWALVPIVATDDQVAAAIRVTGEQLAFETIYDAMIAAAPQPEAGGNGGATNDRVDEAMRAAGFTGTPGTGRFA